MNGVPAKIWSMVKGLSSTEIGYVDGASTTVTANKVVIADANKDVNLGTGDLTATKIQLTTPIANQADLATDANGTAIAGAVNGLRNALVTAGIMAAGE